MCAPRVDSLFFAAVLYTPLALAQATLGALLDVGASRVPPEVFKSELVQRMVVGPTSTGGMVEMMYAPNGTVQGSGSMASMKLQSPMNGEWTIDGAGRVCAAISLSAGPGSNTSGYSLPSRCQYWFKLGEKYFIADSDTDRSAKVLVRTIKQ
jgi:hypothetical protein